MSDEGNSTDLQVRVDKLEAKLEQVYDPKLRGDLPAAVDRMETLEQENKQLRSRIDQLESRVETIIGVPSADASTHDKRVQDTRQILLRRAELTQEERSSVYWREIADALAGHGHGELHDTQVKRVMEDVVTVDGFSLSTGKRDVSSTDDRSDIREVQVVECVLDDVPGSDPVNNVVGGEPHQPSAQTADRARPITEVIQD